MFRLLLSRLSGLFQHNGNTAKSNPSSIPMQLEAAVRRGDTETVKALVAAGASPIMRDSAGVPMLMRAVFCKNVDMCRTLIAVGANVDDCDPDGDSILHMGVRTENVEIVSLLLDASAKVDNRGSPHCGESPLMSAIATGEMAVVQRLIDAKANIDFVSHRLFGTPLIVAVQWQRYEIISTLLAKGANPNLGHSLWSTPLTVAAALADKKSLHLLLTAGADVNACAGPGTPLIAAAYNGQVEIVRLLLDIGADPNLDGSAGETALITVAHPEGSWPYMMPQTSSEDAHLVIAKILLASGASAVLPNRNGQTALGQAVASGSAAMVDLLRSSQQ